MDVLKEKARRKNLITRTWERCRSLGSNTKNSSTSTHGGGGDKMRRWHSSISTTAAQHEERQKKCQVAPDGCFSVLVGTEKKRFAVKTEYVNHPMFRMLLEDAESEFGFRSEGPIVLPCDADLFYRVLAEMENGDDDDDVVGGTGCRIGCSPARLRHNASRSGSYSVLHTRSRMIKMNQ